MALQDNPCAHESCSQFLVVGDVCVINVDDQTMQSSLVCVLARSRVAVGGLACASRVQGSLTEAACASCSQPSCMQSWADGMQCSSVDSTRSHLHTLAAETSGRLWTGSLQHQPKPSLLYAMQAWQSSGSIWAGLGHSTTQVRHKTELSRVRVPKSASINDTIMPNTTDLKFGLYGIRAITGKRVAANTIEAVRKTLRRRIKKTARLWVRMRATVPVTRKPQGIRMGKGKGAIAFYATPIRPGQIIFEMDRVPKKVAVQAMQAIQAKFPCKLGFVEFS